MVLQYVIMSGKTFNSEMHRIIIRVNILHTDGCFNINCNYKTTSAFASVNTEEIIDTLELVLTCSMCTFTNTRKH